MRWGAVEGNAPSLIMMCRNRLPFDHINTSFIILSEAVDAILCHSQSASQVLGRRKIRHDVLFRYLDANKVSISAQCAKPELVTCLLDYWSSQLFMDRTNGKEIQVRNWLTIILYERSMR